MRLIDRLVAHLATLPADYPVTPARIARALELQPQVASIYLKRLAQRGHLVRVGETPVQAAGGRRAPIYRVTAPSPPR